MSPSRTPLRRHRISQWLALLGLALTLFAQACLGHAIRSESRQYGRLSNELVPAIAALSDPAKILDTTNPKSLLSKILIPRPPDTDNIRKVKQAIIDVFRNQLGAKDSDSFTTMDWKSNGKLGWHIEEHSFTADTPEGKKRMTNIIFTKNPAASRKLVIAAHYDSKFTPLNFIGATDSAAPCAMMVDLAVALDDALDARERKIHQDEQTKPSIAQETTLQLVFFDGEEAFRAWTHTDSIYGARELAKHWTTTYWDATKYDSSRTFHAPKLVSRRLRSAYGPIEHMNTMEHLVLLDLLGAPNPTIPSYFNSTKWFHEALVDAEKRLRDANVLWPAGNTGKSNGGSFFSPHKPWGAIEDDHLPFLHAGVPILHLIPSPFPSVWHKMADDVNALDYPTMYAWCMILRLAVAEYLDLDIEKVAPKRREGAGMQQEEVGEKWFWQTETIGEFASDSEAPRPHRVEL